MNTIDPITTQEIAPHRHSDPALWGVCALLFVTCTAVTVAGCRSMATMREMPMPGGWTMSMTWMRMPGQTVVDATLSFLGMWGTMMAAMMLPSLLPMLLNYRHRAGATPEMNLGVLTTLVGVGYFVVWTVAGLMVFGIGAALASIAMQLPAVARMVPMVGGGIIVLAGAAQFSAWKTHHLACWRRAPTGKLPTNAGTAWRHGLRLGLHCSGCCANLTLALLIVGVMDLRAMAMVTTAITVERLAPTAARAIGAVLIGIGLFMLVRAAGR